jgi:FtsZ-binding cell division protein ZapB
MNRVANTVMLSALEYEELKDKIRKLEREIAVLKKLAEKHRSERCELLKTRK